MIDDTPPVCVQYRVRDGSHRMLDQDYQSSNSSVIVTWRGAMFDLESLVGSYEVQLEDATTGDVIVPAKSVGISNVFEFSELRLSQAQVVRTVVTAVNRAGVRRECATDGVLVDITGPLPTPHSSGVVWDGNSLLRGYTGRDMSYTWSAESAFASWARFIDPESGINNYYVWAERLSDGETLSAPVWVHPSLTEWTIPLSTQQHGDTYRVVLQATNRAGSQLTFHTDGVIVDLTPPVFESDVEFTIDGAVGLEPHIVASTSALLRVRVEVTDPESGIQVCRYALGTYPDGSDVSGVTSVRVADLPAEARVDTQVQRGGNTVCYADGSCEVVPETNETLTTSLTLDAVLNEGFPLVNHLSLYAWVVCINQYVHIPPVSVCVHVLTLCLLLHRASNYVRARAANAYLVDALPPSAGLVLDGLRTRPEVDVSPSNETFAGYWRWWVDQESGIRFYEVALGTSPGSDDTRAWANVGLHTSVHMSFFGADQLAHAQTYYLTVRATDNAGHRTVLASDGVTIDITPALQGRVEHGLHSDVGVQKYSNKDNLVLMRWADIVDPQVRAHSHTLTHTFVASITTKRAHSFRAAHTEWHHILRLWPVEHTIWRRGRTA